MAIMMNAWKMPDADEFFPSLRFSDEASALQKVKLSFFQEPTA